MITEQDEVEAWNELLDRHHYLGYRRPFGPHLRYAIVDCHGRWLGCLQFAYAARSLLCRDQFIGWDEAARHHSVLTSVIGNSRFLLFPWVRVENLARRPSLVVRRLADDWQAQHGYRPVLVAFVDLSRFRRTCYRAANWVSGRDPGQGVGANAERRSSTDQDPDAAEDGATSQATRQRRVRTPRSNSGPRCWTRWSVARDFDRQWQRRQRSLNTLLVVLFLFRLVFSIGRGTGRPPPNCGTSAACWGLEQASPPPSAMCNARAKVDENLFRVLK